MARPEKEPLGSNIDPNAWMVTFSDLLMLMLTFFVLLLTMSSMDEQLIREIARSGIQTADNGQPGTPEAIIAPVISITVGSDTDSLSRQAGSPSDRVEQALEQALDRHHLEGKAWLERRPEGWVISVDGAVAFEDGRYNVTERARALLTEFAVLARAVDLNVSAEAFVADPEHPFDRDEHWNLAALRAGAVAQVLIADGIAPERVSASAYGYPGGRDELRFVQQSQLLELTLLTGPPRAVPAAN
ncbi:MAG: chemotaxis protein MotB [Bradymonadia bacterium]|jgi:chemotaxis protein MotB